MRARRWIVLALVIVLGLGPAAWAQGARPDDPLAAMRDERRVALVVGNTAYGDSIGWLPNPANDARAMAEVLEELGFAVALLIDATRNQLQEALLPFEQALRAADIGLFYYAGHAVQVAGRNFLIPIGTELNVPPDADPEAIAHYVDVKTVDVDQVLGLMAIAKNRLNIVILDACRDNPFARGTRGITRGLAQTSAPRGTLIAYATAPGRVALDGPAGGHSHYTAALLDVLQEQGLPIETAFKRVRERVLEQTDTRQTPWENSSLVGEFYFRLPDDRSAPFNPESEPSSVAGPSEQSDLIVWNGIQDSQIAADFETFIDAYPDSPFVRFARHRLEALHPLGPPEGLQPPTQSWPSDSSSDETSLGLRGEDRRVVQQALLALGFSPGGIDGIFGPKTRAAIARWQSDQDAEPTGYLTSPQYAALVARGDANLKFSQRAEISPPEPEISSIDFGTYHALVIGNDTYEHLPDLQNAVADANALGQLLKSRYCFMARILTNAGRYKILSAMNQLRAQLTPEDNLLVYYAGNSNTADDDSSTDWLPIDAAENADENWISHISLTDMVNTMNAKHVLIITDGHFFGGGQPMPLPSDGGESRSEHFERVKTLAGKQSRHVLTSGYPPLDGGANRHSPFARALLEVLEHNDTVLAGHELYREVMARVGDSDYPMGFRHLPQYAPIKHAGHQRGEFFFKPLAEQGDAKVQTNLGWMYENGRGVLQDDALAVGWYRKAAEQGYAPAQYHLGLMYEHGRGVAQDESQAIAWYRKAAEQNYARAQYNLGMLYVAGRGVPQDRPQSIAWFRKAEAQGHDDAYRALRDADIWGDH